MTDPECAASGFWERLTPSALGAGVPLLAQGDVLENIEVPDFEGLGTEAPIDGVVEYRRRRLIVLTQSCDLGDREPADQQVLLCRLLGARAALDGPPPGNNWRGKPKERFNTLVKGFRPDAHLLGDWENPGDPAEAKVASFRHLHTLRLDQVRAAASRVDVRHRLRSPYREHFSQAYARFYMRVGLPTDLPRM